MQEIYKNENLLESAYQFSQKWPYSLNANVAIIKKLVNWFAINQLTGFLYDGNIDVYPIFDQCSTYG